MSSTDVLSYPVAARCSTAPARATTAEDDFTGAFWANVTVASQVR
jgi:hypothetical protein